MEKFKHLGLSEGMLNAIKQAGFTEPSEIQEKTIPLVVEGKDVIGGSATGSGKTLAFGAGIIDKVKRGNGIQALIMTPTRELAEQVARTIRTFSRHLGLNVKEVYGGVGMGAQINDLRHSDIVVGTPGRLLDHLQRRTLNLSRVRFLVLDEADRMLDMGFIKDVESIIRHCPAQRQTLLFSATISQEILHISNKYMRNPVQVSVKNQIDSSLLYQAFYELKSEEKFSLLVHLLKLEKEGVVMVFCNTRRNVDKLTKSLNDHSLHALALHGGLSQNQRSHTLNQFHQRDTLILVCTDVAARGLDIKGVSHVYNFDIPSTPTEYTHRIGRTARAGKKGITISFVSPGDRGEFKQIFKQNASLEELRVPNTLDRLTSVSFGSNEERKNARRGGGRGFGGGQGSRGGYGRSQSFPRERRENSGGFHRGGDVGRSFSPGRNNRERDSRGDSRPRGNFSRPRTFGRDRPRSEGRTDDRRDDRRGFKPKRFGNRGRFSRR